MKKSLISKIISIILIIILVCGTCSIIFIPSLYDIFKDKSVDLFKNHNIYYKVAFYICYIICLIIVYMLIKLFNIIYKESPFRKEIEKLLYQMAIMFIILSLIVLVKGIFIPSLLTFVVSLLCFLISLSFYVLKEVIKVAIEYKKEVDFTV